MLLCYSDTTKSSLSSYRLFQNTFLKMHSHLSIPWNRKQGQQWNQGDKNMIVNAVIQVCQLVYSLVCTQAEQDSHFINSCFQFRFL